MTMSTNEATEREPFPKRGNQLVAPALVDDILRRSRKGTIKYGSPLMTQNGRNALVDAYQEAIDLAMYLKQALMELDAAQAASVIIPPAEMEGVSDRVISPIKEDE